VSCRYVEAIDQGTSSTRFIIFDESTRIVAEAQREHEQIYTLERSTCARAI
jgi:glycerol kinase